MKICIVSGSRADYGLLEWPIRTLKADPFFEVSVINIWGTGFSQGASFVNAEIGPTGKKSRYDLMLILGDRYEILAAASAAHLQRLPIAHLCGGDVTEGSYDWAMRDCISRLASLHFVSSTSAMARLSALGYTNIHLVGNPGLDYIRHADWKKPHPMLGLGPCPEPYVVVSYQADTIEAHPLDEMITLEASLPECKRVFILPNPDLGSDEITGWIKFKKREQDLIYDFLPHDKFLNLIYHCDEFIGNSSSMLYEAPELGVKVRMIGKRQRGRVIPWGDGNASERIAKILKYTHL